MMEMDGPPTSTAVLLVGPLKGKVSAPFMCEPPGPNGQDGFGPVRY
jgi:hypothetical protein